MRFSFIYSNIVNKLTKEAIHMIYSEDRSMNNKSENERGDSNMKNSNNYHHDCNGNCKNSGKEECKCNKHDRDDFPGENTVKEFIDIMSKITGCNVMVQPLSEFFNDAFHTDESFEDNQQHVDNSKEIDDNTLDFIAKKLAQIDLRLCNLENVLESRSLVESGSAELKVFKPSKKITKKMKRYVRDEIGYALIAHSHDERTELMNTLGIRCKDDIDALQSLIAEKRSSNKKIDDHDKCPGCK